MEGVFSYLNRRSAFLAAMSAFAKASARAATQLPLDKISVDAAPPHAAPHRSGSLNGLEEVVGNVATDCSSDVRPFLVGVAEVEPS
jgi:hypothetical protein